MKLRKAISMKEYRRRRKARGFAGEPRRRRIPRRSQERVEPRASSKPKKAREWAKPLPLSPSLQVRAKTGMRAVILPLKPGLFLVGEVPEGAVAQGAQKVAGAMVKVAQGALGSGGTKALPAPRALPAPVEEPKDDDVEGLFGCERCGGRCGGGR